jgi:hypothetical protein
MVFFNEDALRGAVREFVAHYHEERNHRGWTIDFFHQRRLSSRLGSCESASDLAVYSTTSIERSHDS